MKNCLKKKSAEKQIGKIVSVRYIAAIFLDEKYYD